MKSLRSWQKRNQMEVQAFSLYESGDIMKASSIMEDLVDYSLEIG